MFSKDNEILDPNNIRNLLEVSFLDVSEYLNFDKGLLVELGFVFDDFEGQELFFLVIKHLENFTIASFSHLLNNLIPVANMIVNLINILIST